MENRENRLFWPPKNELNQWSQNIIEVVDNTNIPYDYLPSNVRENISEIIKSIILPNLQTKLRSTENTSIMQEKISKYKEIYHPQKTPPSEFISQYKEITNKKISLQKEMALLIANAIETHSLDKTQAEKILHESDLLEPRYFAISSQAKVYTDYCQEKIFSSFGKLLSEEEKWLIITPSQTACYIQKELDLSEYFSGNHGITESTIEDRYFNSDPYLTEKYLNKHKAKYSGRSLDDITEARMDQKIQTNRKIYFLLERKIPLAKELDDISVMDHCFDKYLESKQCFLHDLFLKILLTQQDLSSFIFPEDLETLTSLIIETINTKY